jgi:hypothetical protein
MAVGRDQGQQSVKGLQNRATPNDLARCMPSHSATETYLIVTVSSCRQHRANALRDLCAINDCNPRNVNCHMARHDSCLALSIAFANEHAGLTAGPSTLIKTDPFSLTKMDPPPKPVLARANSVFRRGGASTLWNRFARSIFARKAMMTKR